MTESAKPGDILNYLPEHPTPENLYDAFQEWATSSGISLYPHQDEALFEIVAGSHVIVSTPTGSGKSLIALAAHFRAMSLRERSYYTAPIKALVSEKFFELVKAFGTQNVGLMTGDSAVNPKAPIICCTAEVLANQILREGSQTDVHQVVMDEFHYYSEPDRGWAWQVPLLELPKAQFILMSATLGDIEDIQKDLTKRTGQETAHITSAERPVPLDYEFVMTPLQETVEKLLEDSKTPIYLVHFSQAAAAEQAQALTSVNISSRAERDLIAQELQDFTFSPGFGKTLGRLIKHGIGVHHAGMLPKYRRLVERLAQQGLLKVICGTDTLGVGINVPIRTVVFTALTKFDGERMRHLRVREFQQIAGRAGRAGFDTAGTVVAQAPEHIIENQRALAKAEDNPKKKKRIAAKKKPEGFVSWNNATFERLIESKPEELRSQFQVNHAMILNMVMRPEDPFRSLSKLLRENHETPENQRKHIRRALTIAKELVRTEIIERLPEPDKYGRTYRLTVDLQPNFALNQPLSPFALAALELLDPESEDYALDVISVLEATLENPRQVLSAQQYKARTEALAEMKAEGLDYTERMEALEQVTHPQPLAELLEDAFTYYQEAHPWVADYELSPKAVVRDIFERAMSFNDFVKFYGLERSEGVLLRYLSDAYDALRKTIPQEKRTEELIAVIEWLGSMVSDTDSSLLAEWEALAHPESGTSGHLDAQNNTTKLGELSKESGLPTVIPLTMQRKAFTALVRNALFQRVEYAAREDYAALERLDASSGWNGDRWADALDEYFGEYDDIGIGPEARSAKLFQLDASRSSQGFWDIQQIFDDPEHDHDWRITAEVDLEASDLAQSPAIRVLNVHRL